MSIIKLTCDIISAVFAGLAAVSWVMAARAPVHSAGFVGYADAKYIEDVKREGAKVARGAAWNRRAAACAAVSAAAQAVSIGMSIWQ